LIGTPLGSNDLLSDFLDIEGGQALSAVVLEYGCSPEARLSAESRAVLEEARFHALWSWGLYCHVSGNPTFSDADFADRSQFILDNDRYQAFIAPVVRGGALGHAFRVPNPVAH
jgi:hypothetical protein